jgi:dnd system-associated protein 4
MRRIQRETSHEEFIKNLTSGDAAIFKEIWRVLLFAAALGVNEGIRRPLGSTDSGKAIPETYFSTPGWKGFLYLIGVADTGDSECLRGTELAQDALVTAFEEYANHGLYVLSDRMKLATSPFDELISLLLEVSQPPIAKPVIDLTI